MVQISKPTPQKHRLKRHKKANLFGIIITCLRRKNAMPPKLNYIQIYIFTNNFVKVNFLVNFGTKIKNHENE